MPNPIVGIAAAGVGSSVVGAKAQSRAAGRAADAQQEASAQSIAEQRRQFDAVQRLLAPYVDIGTEATGALANLAGFEGAGAQQRAITDIERGPEFQALLAQGEEAILANAAATGGLRGGNTQAALGEFRPSLLANQIANRYQRLGGLAGMGQAAAAGQASAAQNLGASVSGALQQSGAARAGAALASGRATANLAGGIGQSLGTVFGAAMPQGGIPQGQGIFTQWGGF